MPAIITGLEAPHNPTPFQRGSIVYPEWNDTRAKADYICLGVVYLIDGAVRVVIENAQSGAVSVVDPRILRTRL